MKLLNFLIIFFFIGLVNLYSNNLIIESEGFSIISDNLNQSRQNAIDDAINKGIEKLLKNRGIQLDKSLEEQIKNQAVSGYEIIKEEVDGNILKEKIRLLLDEDSLNDFIHPVSKNPIKIDIFASFNENFDSDLVSFLETLIRDNFDYNFIFSPVKNFDEITDDFNIKLFLKINLNKIKKLLSVNSYLYNLYVDIKIYDKQNNLFDNSSITKNIIIVNEKEYINYVSNFIKPFIKKDFSELLRQEVENTKISKKILFVILEKVKKFDEIEQFDRILDNFNIKYSLITISNGKLIYKVNGISKNTLKNILGAKDLNFKIIEEEGRNDEGLF